MGLRIRQAGINHAVSQAGVRQGASYTNVKHLFVKTGDEPIDQQVPPTMRPVYKLLQSFVPPETNAVPPTPHLSTKLLDSGLITPPAGFTDALRFFVPAGPSGDDLLWKTWQREYRVETTAGALIDYLTADMDWSGTLEVDWRERTTAEVRVFARYRNEVGGAPNWSPVSNTVLVNGGVADGNGGWNPPY
jgi:hypothetical protein